MQTIGRSRRFVPPVFASALLAFLAACSEPTAPTRIDGIPSPDLTRTGLVEGTLIRIVDRAQTWRGGNPAISGDRIVWQGYHNGELDILVYNAVTTTVAAVTADPAWQLEPAISGDRVVWQDYRNGSHPDVFMFSFATDTETPIITHPAAQARPEISGKRIVWQDYRKGTRFPDIFMYDLASASETQITDDLERQHRLAISGDRIVWQDWRNGPHNPDIFMFDLGAGVESQITTDPRGTSAAPDISGERIVYLDSRNGTLDIFMREVSKGTETLIAAATVASANEPVAISGDRIVWIDGRFGSYDVFMYDVSTDSEIRITSTASYKEHLDISGDRVVWEDYRNESPGPGIYMFEISDVIVASIDAMRDKIDEFLDDGSIDNAGYAESLYALLDQAEAAMARENDRAATNALNAFIASVEAQAGNHITEPAAQLLVDLARAIIDSM